MGLSVFESAAVISVKNLWSLHPLHEEMMFLQLTYFPKSSTAIYVKALCVNMDELEELLHSAYEKALPNALSNFHTHFSGIFVMSWQLIAKIVFILLK